MLVCETSSQGKCRGSCVGAQGLGSADPQTEWNGKGQGDWLSPKVEMVLMTVTSGDQPLLNPVCAFCPSDQTWLAVRGWQLQGLFAKTGSGRCQPGHVFLPRPRATISQKPGNAVSQPASLMSGQRITVGNFYFFKSSCFKKKESNLYLVIILAIIRIVHASRKKQFLFFWDAPCCKICIYTVTVWTIHMMSV